MRRRFLTTTILALAALVATTPASAHACSCIAPDIERDLPMADGAVVGVLRPTPDAGSASPARTALATITIEHVAKGRIDGDAIEVRHVGSSAACGLDMSPGQRVGLLLQRDPSGTWSSSLCSMVDPDELAQVEPASAPTGTGDEPASGLLERLVALLRRICGGSAAARAT